MTTLIFTHKVSLKAYKKGEGNSGKGYNLLKNNKKSSNKQTKNNGHERELPLWEAKRLALLSTAKGIRVHTILNIKNHKIIQKATEHGITM